MLKETECYTHMNLVSLVLAVLVSTVRCLLILKKNRGESNRGLGMAYLFLFNYTLFLDTFADDAELFRKKS